MQKPPPSTGLMSQRTPLLLRVWMLATWCLAFPLAALSRLLHRRMGADPARFGERLGHGAAPGRRPVLWFHAASLGEVTQIAPLARHLSQTGPHDILVTTTTASGADWVARQMPFATHRFAPIETPAAITRFLDGWPIAAALFVEGDLWPRLLRALEARGVPRILLNARHSRTRARFPASFAALLRPFALITCRSDAIAAEMRALGLPAERIHVPPDLRLTVPRLDVPPETLAQIAPALGTRPVWLAASTHPSDEKAVLEAQRHVLAAHPEALLILVPRHPVRAAPLLKQAQAKALSTAQRSAGQEITAETQVYLADTIGELGVFFTLAPLAFLGGSFGQEGGHNPYEPAHFDTALLHGPHVKNFAEAYAALGAAGAALQVTDPGDLGPEVARLLNSETAQTMGRAGCAFMQEAQGNTTRYAALIAATLPKD